MLELTWPKGLFIVSLKYSDQTKYFVFDLGKVDKKTPSAFTDDVLNKNPASSYSPTQLPVQYHRRWKA